MRIPEKSRRVNHSAGATGRIQIKNSRRILWILRRSDRPGDSLERGRVEELDELLHERLEVPGRFGAGVEHMQIGRASCRERV